MSAYAIVNLQDEVEDSLGERTPGIEGRFARTHLDSEHLGVSYLRYSPGVRSPSAHNHREQEEAYVVISGSGQVRLDDEIHALPHGRSAAQVFCALHARPDPRADDGLR